MNACCRKTPLRRGLAAGAWLIPGGLLVLMPKCPVCVAGYIALLTGAGISIPAASGIRIALIAACTAALLFLACRLARTLLPRAAARGGNSRDFQP